MKKSRFATQFSVGFVLFVATIVVIVGLFFVGSGRSLFTDHVEYRVRLPNASGLRSGSGVFLSGFMVGSVSKISFPDDLRVSEVEVAIHVEKGYRDRIRQDSYIWLQSQGLLGDVAIQIKPGTADGGVAEPGSLLTYKDRPLVEELLGEKISTGTADLLRATIAMLEEINRGEGTIGKLLKNPELYSNLNALTISMDAATKQLQGISQEFEAVLKDIRSQQGTLGKLIFSEEYAKEFTEALRSANGLLANARELSEDLKEGRGTAGKLFTGPEMHDAGVKTLKELTSVASRLDRLLVESEASGGVLARIFKDGETGRHFSDLVARLERGASSLEKILQTVEQGEGSVGMLVHDPSIAASLRDLFLGVQELGLVQTIVRNAEQAGREAYLRDVDLASREEQEIRRARALAAIKKSKPAAPARSGPAEAGSGEAPAAAPGEPKAPGEIRPAALRQDEGQP